MMGSPATIFIYIGIIVLALAVIAIVLWVAMLSNRIKKLSDRIMYDATAPRETQTPPTAINGWAASANGGSQAQQPQVGYGMQGASQTPSQTPMGNAGMQPHFQGGQTVRPIQPAVNRVHTGAVQPMEMHDDQAFFDSYRSQSQASQHSGTFGREKPTIPFGADKSGQEKRDSYARDAVNEDYDPDSIDFSRVAGYRNVYRQ